MLLMIREETPLHLAAWNGHVDVVKLLIQNGADVNAGDEDTLDFTSHYACRRCEMLIRWCRRECC